MTQNSIVKIGLVAALVSLAVSCGLCWFVGYEHHHSSKIAAVNGQPNMQLVYDRVMTTGTINCGYFTWPPYLMRDAKTGKLSGINYDYMQAIGRFLNLKINWVQEVGVGEIETALNADKFDMMCSTMWPGGAVRGLTYTAPILFTDVYAYVRAGDMRFDGDLSKINHPQIKIVAMESDVSVDTVRLNFSKASLFMLSKVDDAVSQIVAVKTHKADVAFLDQSFVDDYNKQAGKVVLVRVKNVPPLQTYGEHFAFKSGEDRLKELLDVAILTVNNSAVMPRILEKYPNLASKRMAKAWAD
jgi:ABC-type amino acid transport substrate-binding protein